MYERKSSRIKVYEPRSNVDRTWSNIKNEAREVEMHRVATDIESLTGCEYRSYGIDDPNTLIQRNVYVSFGVIRGTNERTRLNIL
jgi:hypothetical protein